MTIEDLLSSKDKKAKEKTQTISKWLLDGSMPTDELIAVAGKLKDPEKATCIEALEYATKQNPELADETVFSFVVNALADKTPRVKWESAKVIGNIAPLFPSKLNKAIPNLLVNSEYDGTVVRWAAAYALGEILKLKTKHNKGLIPAVEALSVKEKDNAIKKKYLDALKKTKK